MKMPKAISAMLRTDPDAELARVRARHAELAARLEALTQASDEAAAGRRAILIEADALDEVALAKADAACRAADDRRRATEEAMREISLRVADMEAARATAVDQAERVAIAAEINARVKRIEKVCADLDRVAEKFADAREALLKVFLADAPPLETGTLRGPAVARCAGFVAGILPHGEHDKIMGVPESAIGAAVTLMEDMKRQAAAILAGSAPAVLPASPQQWINVVIPDVAIVLKCPVSYQGRMGALQHAFAGGVQLPAPVAAAAKQMGVGFDFDSDEGKGLLRVVGKAAMGAAFKRRSDGTWVVDQGETNPETGKTVTRDMYTPIPIDLYTWEEAERARLRSAA